MDSIHGHYLVKIPDLSVSGIKHVKRPIADRAFRKPRRELREQMVPKNDRLRRNRVSPEEVRQAENGLLIGATEASALLSWFMNLHLVETGGKVWVLIEESHLAFQFLRARPIVISVQDRDVIA